ncbi:MAG: hypothetical protein U1D97_09745 [Desulfuromonadales bacterium]|nr:hypothetical protein [Desulfuromonadales bacterium]
MKYWFLFFLLVLLAAPVSAQELTEALPAPAEETGMIARVADRFHLATTERLVSLSEYLDSFFLNPDNRRFDYRRTRVLAQLGLEVDSKGDMVVLQRVTGRIVLPRLEERVSLYFSGAGEDAPQTGEEASSPYFLPTIEDTRFRFGFNTALRFIFTASDYYLVQNQLGVRLFPNMEPYNELSVQLRIPLGRKFLWQPGQSLFWRESSGFGETTRYDLDYALKPGAIIRLHQEGTFSQETNGFEHLHSLSYLRQLEKERGYVLSLEARGETSPKKQMTQYLVIFVWKELVHRDWLYIETGSKLRFSEEDNFSPIPAIFFSLIADFSGKKGAQPPSRPREEPSPSPL